MDAAAKMLFDQVREVLQRAEELGGPDGASYLELMDAVATEARKREAIARGTDRVTEETHTKT